MDEKRFRIDLYIAALALIFSGLAALAAAYQTYVIRQQFSATVWPYLIFISSSSTKWFELDVSNAGIGPALIRYAEITRDGKRLSEGNVPSSSPALAQAIVPERSLATNDERRARSHEPTDVTSSSISRGDVIPAGSKLELLRVANSFLAKRIIADGRRFDISLCYCSLLGDCWTKRLWDPSDEPHSVRSCPMS
ncbi:MAG TPA: hypothetical protein VGK84_08340 [Candidatus Tumulicola sp.]